MFRVKVEGNFSAAHRLRGYLGKCEALHGHNWRVEVVVSGKRLDRCGMLFDFSKLKARLREVLENFDHRYLNDLACFKKCNPTSENIAKIIFLELKKKNPGICAVTVWESENAAATYSKE